MLKESEFIARGVNARLTSSGFKGVTPVDQGGLCEVAMRQSARTRGRTHVGNTLDGAAAPVLWKSECYMQEMDMGLALSSFKDTVLPYPTSHDGEKHLRPSSRSKYAPDCESEKAHSPFSP